jgi:hypothetical protein
VKFLPLFLLFAFQVASAQQNRANNWFYAHHAGITFNTGNPTTLGGGQTQTNEGTSCMSDNAGNLLFYSDGVKVWNRNHDVMPNGTGLHGDGSSTQSCLIIPWPERPNLYFLFTAPNYSANFGLEYSVIDMTLDGGFGDVTSERNIMLMDSSTEKLTAAMHRNGREVWVVGHKFESNDFYAWKISVTGIDTIPVISSVGTLHQSYTWDTDSRQNKIGTMKISPCGTQIACVALYDSFAELFDFNDSTGVVSNPLYLGVWPGSFPYGVYGVEFSPACSKLYISSCNPSFVVQYDLSVPVAAAILASADTVISSSSEYFGTLQNGPDGRTYLSRAGYNYLGCITEPEQAGSACQYVASYVNAGNTATAIYGLPNFIVNWLHRETTSMELVQHSEDIILYPNPGTDFLNLSIKNGRNKKSSIEIRNVYGHVILFDNVEAQNYSFDVAQFPAGLYFITIIQGDNIITKKFLKQ